MKITKSHSKKPCKHCGSFPANHYPYQCFKNPKRKQWKINKIGKVTRSWILTRKIWFTNNPPDEYGFYYCYLGISPRCLKKMTPRQTTLDHLQPRGSHPSLRFNLNNLFPACLFCNNLKGSMSVDKALKLSVKYKERMIRRQEGIH